jgi:hypothetical protein
MHITHWAYQVVMPTFGGLSPAKAGIQECCIMWTPAYAGVT